jgi:hypothetical protein
MSVEALSAPHLCVPLCTFDARHTQEKVHLLVPPDAGIYNFWVTMVLALVGQSVGLLWIMYAQVK